MRIEGVVRIYGLHADNADEREVFDKFEAVVQDASWASAAVAAVDQHEYCVYGAEICEDRDEEYGYVVHCSRLMYPLGQTGESRPFG